MMLLLLFACDDEIFLAAGGDGGAVIIGDSYEDAVAIFDGNCVGCHSVGGAAGGLDLESDPCANTVGVGSPNYGDTLVNPGDHEASVLWSKIADAGVYGGSMPPTGALPTESVDTIAAWIDAGAACDTADTGGTP